MVTNVDKELPFAPPILGKWSSAFFLNISILEVFMIFPELNFLKLHGFILPFLHSLSSKAYPFHWR